MPRTPAGSHEISAVAAATDRPGVAQHASQFASATAITHTLSVTITPYHESGGVQFSDTDRLTAVELVLGHLDVEFALRYGDEQVPVCLFARERGDTDSNPHINGHYDIACNAVSRADVTKLVKREKAWLKAQLEHVDSDVTFRLTLKKINPRDRAYAYGYDMKDTGKAHFMKVHHGFTLQELQDCLDFYRAKASQNFHAAKKMNKAPGAASKQLDFCVGNLYQLCKWFVDQHSLQPIAPYLETSIIVAYALQTGKYRLDESLVTGKHGGGVIDPVRDRAYLQLSLGGTASTARTVPLIETVLYGSPQTYSTVHDAECLEKNLPTTAQLARTFDLDRAKKLCACLPQGLLHPSFTAEGDDSE